MQKVDYKKLLFLDGIRGLAAIYVMIGHARWLLWEGYSTGYVQHPEEYSLLNKLLVYSFSAFRYGHEAVLLFFVLSGFVIYLKYAVNLSNGNSQFDILAFYKRRIRRIMPPLLSALTITFILDSIGIFADLPIYKMDTIYPSINENIGVSHTLNTLMGNLGFLMKFYTPVFGSDGPLWSLAYEGWFYITFPLFFVVLRKNSLLAGLIMVGLFVVANFIGTGFVLFDKVFGLMLCWWLGIVLADIYVGRIKIKWIYLAPLVFLIPILILDLFPLIGHNLSSLYWSLGFFGMFSTLFWMQSNNISLQILEKLKITGDFSYTLYVIHMPILVLFSGILMVQNEEKSLPSNFIFVFLGILFTMVVSKFVYHWVEKPFLTKR